jgi:hypothetical protein
MIRSKDIILLLGAGASAEAGIPTSAKMIRNIEDRLEKEWKHFAGLYNHVRSAIHYAAGLKGCFGDGVSYNIETLVNTLYELERNEEHPLYPFIASWNSRFVSLAGAEFGQVRLFRHQILEALKEWMCPADPSEADYYRGIVTVQRALNFPLRVFSLNYDRCVERLERLASDFVVETGFPGFGKKNVWTWERFNESARGANPLPQVFLYKLHGSIDWVRDENTKDLSRVDQVQGIRPEQLEIIFGREFKLEAADPYLFYAYEFRQAALDARLIALVGYGFGDTHINKMLTQAFRAEGARRLVVVGDCQDSERSGKKQDEVVRVLGVEPDKVHVEPGTAATFFGRTDLGEWLIGQVPESKDAVF